MNRLQHNCFYPGCPGHQSRRGTILVMFMMSLLLLSLTVAALVRVTLTHRGLVDREHLSLQAEWLFQSAVTRASTQLNADPQYTGEEWSVSPSAPGQSQGGTAEIRVTPDEEETNARQVEITVNYPADTEQRARVSRAVSIQFQ